MLMIFPPRPCLTICLATAWLEKKQTLLVDLDDVVPILFGKFQQRRAPNDAGVVDQNIHAAEFLHRGVNDAANGFRFAADRPGSGKRGGPARGFFCAVSSVVVASHQRDIRAGFRQPDRHRPPNPRPAPVTIATFPFSLNLSRIMCSLNQLNR